MADIGTHTVVNESYRDRSGEVSRTGLNYPPLDDSASNDALLDPVTGTIAVTGTALALLSECRQAGSTISIKLSTGTPGLPSDPLAQRELAARMRYQDNVTGQYYRFDIPGPVAGLQQDGTDAVDMSLAAMVAFKTAFEANCVSPDGNAVTLLDGRIVGRRS